MMRVLAAYYVGFIVLALASVISNEISYGFLSTLIVFYGSLTVYDNIDIATLGYASNSGRYLDTAVHVIFGTVALIILSSKVIDVIAKSKSGEKEQ